MTVSYRDHVLLIVMPPASVKMPNSRDEQNKNLFNEKVNEWIGGGVRTGQIHCQEMELKGKREGYQRQLIKQLFKKSFDQK